MSKSSRGRRFFGSPLGMIAIALLVVVAVAGGRYGQTRAQDSTPAASGDCVAATATADGASVAVASPEALEGTPVDSATADVAIAAAQNLVNCLNAGDFESAVTLGTPAFLAQFTGSSDPAEAAANLQAASDAGLLPTVTVESADADSVVTYDDGRASLDLTYMQGEYQYVAARWYMVPAGDTLLIDEEVLQEPNPDADTTVISASIPDDTTAVVFDQRNTILESEAVVIHIINNGAEAHSFVVFAAPAGAATPMADGTGATPSASEAVTGELVGSVTVGAGSEEDLALLNLEPGTYVLLDPNVDGSVATLTITPLDI